MYQKLRVVERDTVEIESGRIGALLTRERERFTDTHPASAVLHRRGETCLLNGVPMNWMQKWASPFPLFLQRAEGARLWDVDGHEYVDLCLGDTAAMAGHAPPAVALAIAERAHAGTSAILPTEDSLAVGEELGRRFGLPFWQFAMTATDANRFAVRIARELTRRRKILVFNWCYHGTLEETMVCLDDGVVSRRPGVVGPRQDASETTRIVEFNDADALERELAHGDVACVLAEPALTNIGIILPEPEFLERMTSLTRTAGSLLIIDETHTLCAGPGGMTAREQLDPDMLVVGKSIGGGVPVAALGMSDSVAARAAEPVREPALNVSGIGGTMSGNALGLCAIRATLETALAPASFERMIALAERWTGGTRAAIADAGLDWSVTQLGCRAEYWPCPSPRTAAEAAVAGDDELEAVLHLHALNRGVLLTPFHNMALMSPATSIDDVERHAAVLRECLAELAAGP